MSNKIEPKNVAKIIRKELKKNFPETKFSVKTSGNAIDIFWTDGPAQKDVDALTDFFKGYEKYSYEIGNGFTQDSYRWVEKEYNGVNVEFGNRYVFTNRTLSDYNLSQALAYHANNFGDPDYWKKNKFSVVQATKHVSAYITGTDQDMIQKIYRYARSKAF